MLNLNFDILKTLVQKSKYLIEKSAYFVAYFIDYIWLVMPILVLPSIIGWLGLVGMRLNLVGPTCAYLWWGYLYFPHYYFDVLLAVTFDCSLIVSIPELCFILPERFKMVIELLVATKLCHVELMWVPKFCEGGLDIVLVHAEDFYVELCASFADEGSIRNIYMC